LSELREITPEREAEIKALPFWRGDIVIRPLVGGISNESWLINDNEGGHVLRIGEDYPFHHVMRDRELMTARAAEVGDFAPAVEYAKPGIMVCRYLRAKTYGEADVRANIDRIATLMRNFHQKMPHYVTGAGFMFWPFHVIRDYANTLRVARAPDCPKLPGYLKLANEFEAAQVPLPIVFGHNDLLPANLLDDGRRLWLIDFEYAGFSTAMFDLAGLSSNAGFSTEESQALLAAYFGRSPEPEVMKSLAAMQCASLLRETLWSMVSERHLNAPGVDYVAYTAENMRRLDSAIDAYRSEYGPAPK
jgi:thiamine kinase-like enzyme